MPIFTVHWKSEINNWSKVEADCAEDALNHVKNGGALDDYDCDPSNRKPYGYRIDCGNTGQGRITKIN